MSGNNKRKHEATTKAAPAPAPTKAAATTKAAAKTSSSSSSSTNNKKKKKNSNFESDSDSEDRDSANDNIVFINESKKKSKDKTQIGVGPFSSMVHREKADGVIPKVTRAAATTSGGGALKKRKAIKGVDLSIEKDAVELTPNNKTPSARWAGTVGQKIKLCVDFNSIYDEKKNPEIAYEHVKALHGDNVPGLSSIYQWKRRFEDEILRATDDEVYLDALLKEEESKKKIRGPKINPKFEKEVAAKLLSKKLQDGDVNNKRLSSPDRRPPPQYSYESVKAALKEVQKEWAALHEKGNLSDEDFKMTTGHGSDGYVHDFLTRLSSSKQKEMEAMT